MFSAERAFQSAIGINAPVDCEDKDKNSTGGIFNYKAPNIAAQQGYVIGIVPDKAASPGKSFLGLVSLVRGTQRLTSCAKESSKNYTFPFDHGIYQKAIGVTPAEMVQASNKGCCGFAIGASASQERTRSLASLKMAT